MPFCSDLIKAGFTGPSLPGEIGTILVHKYLGPDSAGLCSYNMWHFRPNLSIWGIPLVRLDLLLREGGRFSTLRVSTERKVAAMLSRGDEHGLRALVALADLTPPAGW